MKIKTIEIYQFSELSDNAKEVAIDWYRQNSLNDSSAWDTTKEDAKEAGIELKGTYRGYMHGGFLLDFTQVMANIIDNHGECCETYKTAKEYQEKYLKLTEEQETEKEALKEEFLNSILEDYRIMLEKEEEYQNSDEYIIETIEANEYEFTKDGKRA